MGKKYKKRRKRPAVGIAFRGLLVILIIVGICAGVFFGVNALFEISDSPGMDVLALPGNTAEEDIDEELPEEQELPEEVDETEENAGYEYEYEHVHTEGIYEDGRVVNNDLLPWNLILVNRYNFLDEDFVPPLASIGGGHYFDARAADALLSMMESARSEGLSPIVLSPYRSIARQRTLFDNQVNRQIDAGLSPNDAFEAARRVVAYPGSSEHNLGLGVDIVADNYRILTAGFGRTPEGIWLAENAHRYGFVLRYPYHKQDITNIIYEPWHFRYVGIPHAERMFDGDMVLEEYVLEFLHNR